jgi:hypothetical protein
MIKMRAYERLIAYTAYDTASDETKSSCPSSEKQLVFARALVQEMLQMGIDDARVDQYGYVYGTIPETVQGAPVLGYIAHMDVGGRRAKRAHPRAGDRKLRRRRHFAKRAKADCAFPEGFAAAAR